MRVYSIIVIQGLRSKLAVCFSWYETGGFLGYLLGMWMPLTELGQQLFPCRC